MRKQKRFKTKSEIEDAINSAIQLKQKLSEQADFEERESAYCFKECGNPKYSTHEAAHLKDQAVDHKTKLKKLLKRIKAIENSKLPKLKNTLSAFMTQIMPFESDNSVVLQK